MWTIWIESYVDLRLGVYFEAAASCQFHHLPENTRPWHSSASSMRHPYLKIGVIKIIIIIINEND